MTEASKLRPRKDDEPTPEQPAGEESTGVDLRPDGSSPAPTEGADTPAGTSTETPAGTSADVAEGTGSAGGEHPAGDDDGDVDALADAEDGAYKKELRKGLLLGIGTGVIGGLIVSLVLGAFVWPGWFVGAGSPDDVATRSIAAFSARDVAALNAVTCTGTDGKLTSQISADALQEVAGATADGPPTTTVDTEARAPMTLTLSAQGQTQSLPSELVIGQNDGDWCLVGLAQRQQ